MKTYASKIALLFLKPQATFLLVDVGVPMYVTYVCWRNKITVMPHLSFKNLPSTVALPTSQTICTHTVGVSNDLVSLQAQSEWQVFW